MAQLNLRAIQQQQHQSFQTSLSSPSLCGSFDTRRPIDQQQPHRQQHLAAISPTEFNDPGLDAAGLVPAEPKRPHFLTASDYCHDNNAEGAGNAAAKAPAAAATTHGNKEDGSSSRREIPREIDLEPILAANHPGNEAPEVSRL